MPQWRQKFAGRSLPLEKFAVKKSERFSAQDGRLVLPIVEMIYAWNGFNVLRKSEQSLANLYNTIFAAKKEIEDRRERDRYYVDDFCLATFLEAVCLKYLKKPAEAEERLRQVIGLGQHLKDDVYLIPHAMFELGMILKERGDAAGATEQFERAK